ncbi:fimbrial protein [Enterobacter ludwigii]|uniref:fimbrial protein n=1 Tax=Enterobacter ludwigii TaxID=299767 RepID=UPI003BEEF9FC
MKAIYKVTAVAALMAAGMASAMAAQGSGQAQVLIHGEVVPVACTMGPDASTPADINLGSWTASDFTAGTGVYAGLFTVPNSMKTFNVSATGCSGVAPQTGGQFLLTIDRGTPMMDPSDKIFGDQTKAKGTTAGFTLEAKDNSASATAKLYAADDSLVLHTFASGEDWSAVNGTTMKFTTYMAANNATPGTGHVEAPVTFTVNYQ